MSFLDKNLQTRILQTKVWLQQRSKAVNLKLPETTGLNLWPPVPTDHHALTVVRAVHMLGQGLADSSHHGRFIQTNSGIISCFHD